MPPEPEPGVGAGGMVPEASELPTRADLVQPAPVAPARRDARSDTRDEGVSTFAALNVLAYRRLFTTGIFVFLAVQAQQVARGVLAYDLTGSSAALGGVYMGFGLPMLLITPFGGVFADRFPKRRVLLIAQSCLLLSALWIAVADVFGFLEYWMLIGAAVLQGAGFSVYGPTRVAFTGEVVEKRLLPNAVVLTQMGLNGTRVIAPGMAGVFIGVQAVGTGGVYMGTVVLMAIALFVTAGLPLRKPVVEGTRPSVRSQMADGVRYVRAEPTLRLLVLASFVMVMAGWPYLAFLPAISEDLFDAGATGLGVMSSVSALAALAMTFWIAGRSRPSQAWTIQSYSGVALGVGLLLLAAAPTFLAALAALLLVGAAASGYQSMNNTLALTEADLAYHGRVQSLLMLSFSGFGMAALPLGALADAVGLRPTLALMGVVCIVAMTIYTWRRRHHQKH